MLNKPKYMIPSTNLQECTIDLNAEEIPFSCIIDGNESIAAWEIKLYDLGTNSLVFDTGKKSLDQPFLPIDEKNRNNVFSVDLKRDADLQIGEYRISQASSDYDENIAYCTRHVSSAYFNERYDFYFDGYYYKKANITSDIIDRWTSQQGNVCLYEQYYFVNLINFAHPYYWTISFWSTKDKDNELPTVTSCGEAFYANSTPQMTLFYDINGSSQMFGDDKPIFTTNECTFRAVYSQNEDIPIKRYGWRIIDSNTGQILLDTISRNQIYGLAENITCTYKGFSDNNSYLVEVQIETQNNVIISAKANFAISYQTIFLSNDFKTEVLASEAAVINSWEDVNAIEGVSNLDNPNYVSDFPVVGSSVSTVKIRENEQIVYNSDNTTNMDITEDSDFILSMQLLDTSDIILFKAEGFDKQYNFIGRTLSFMNGQFKYSVVNSDGEEFIYEYPPSYEPNEYVWYVIVMKPESLKVYESKAENGLYPSTNRYPTTKLYPSFGEWNIKN